MPHRHSRRRNKTERMLVTTDNVVRVPTSVFRDDDRINLAPKMSLEEKINALSIITSRRDTAREQTDAIAAKMDKWEKQYAGEWQNPEIDDERIYLPKTREQVQVIFAYIMLLVSQLDPIVTMRPMVTSLQASNEEYRKAKVAEALVDYHFDDLWKIRDDVFPRWLKSFLKNTMAVWKVTYREDSFFPDLKIDVVDRSLLYIDPSARDVRSARWIIERYFLPRSEVIQRIDDGHWFVSKDTYDRVMHNTVQMDEANLRRFFGDNFNSQFSVEEDEQIEIWDYWQAPIKGLDDVYAVVIGGEGGELARYGRNPFPYKGLPYRAKSYDPNEFRPDGMGLVEQYRPIQEVVNNFLNMRITDVRKNIIRPVAATGRFITAQTQEDFKNGNKIVRLSEEVMEASRDPSFDLRKHFVELPIGTSTGELLVQDLPFILSQGQESTQISDVFRGQAPPRQATLGQIQEQLTRNQGVFRPIYLQVMRGFEELAEICMEYFKDPAYFPENRIIQIIGTNRYSDVLKDWHNPGGNMFVREVSPDEMDVDVTIDAVNGADALASRTFMMSSLEQIFQGIGQIPELFNELRGELNWPRLVEFMLNTSGHDVEAIRLTPQEKAKKAQAAAQEKQAMQQEAMQMQQMMRRMEAQFNIMEEREKAMAQGQSKVAVDTNKATLDSRAAAHEAKLADLLKDKELTLAHEARLEEITHQVVEELKADLMRMAREAALEATSGKAVGHGNNVNA